MEADYGISSALYREHHMRMLINNLLWHLLFSCNADRSGCAVWGACLRPLACWDCGFESRWGYGCLCVVSVVFCQGVSASGWLLVQRSPTECGEWLSVIVKPRQRGCPGQLRAVVPWKKKPMFSLNILQYIWFPLLSYLLFSWQYFMPFPFSPEEVM